uniref:AP2/ERF domain-containing protein n=1 Tax=Vitrella brassicaformis TaxID=1169539 RepID=A0A7S1PBI9_9ALVE
MRGGQFGCSPPPQRRKRTKRPSHDPFLDPSPPSRFPRSSFPRLPGRPPGRREGDATEDRGGRQRKSVARAARRSDSCDDHNDGSSSSSPEPRQRPKAANLRDGALVSAGDVPSPVYASNPQWAPDTDENTSTRATVITKSEHQSDVTGVAWHEKQQRWMAFWYEKGDPKQKQKLFYVKDHGFDGAKALAEEHRREMERTGRAVVRKRSAHQSGVRGVSYHKGSNSWMASWQVDGKQKVQLFSVRQLGYEGAKQAAIAHHRAMEERHYTFKDRGAKHC